jgi:hypothetical protein
MQFMVGLLYITTTLLYTKTRKMSRVVDKYFMLRLSGGGALFRLRFLGAREEPKACPEAVF